MSSSWTAISQWKGMNYIADIKDNAEESFKNAGRSFCAYRIFSSGIMGKGKRKNLKGNSTCSLEIGCNSFFTYFFPHSIAKIIPLAQASLCVRKENLHQQEKRFLEQLELVTEISVWKQSKPRIMKIGGSPNPRKCSVLHGGKAGKWYNRAIFSSRKMGMLETCSRALHSSFCLFGVLEWLEE